MIANLKKYKFRLGNVETDLRTALITVVSQRMIMNSDSNVDVSEMNELITLLGDCTDQDFD